MRRLFAGLCAGAVLGTVAPTLHAQQPERRDIAIQGDFAEDDVLYDAYLPNGFTNNAIVVPGVALFCEGGVTTDTFINATEPDIYTRVDQFARRNNLDASSTQVMILDIEIPVKLFEYFNEDKLDPALVPDMLEALKRRIRIFAEYFPVARVGLFGTVNPHPHGNESFSSRREAYIRLGQEGVYDNIDLFVPVLYQRFGWHDFDRETVLRLTARMTRQGVEEARALRDSRGRGRPAYPLLAVVIFNSTSPHDETQNDPTYLRHQVEVLRCMGVKDWAIWVGPDSLGEIIVEDPLPPLERLPLSKLLSPILCPTDYNGDGRHDDRDTFFFQYYFLTNDHRADLNLDTAYNAADIAAYVTHASAGSLGCPLAGENARHCETAANLSPE